MISLKERKLPEGVKRLNSVKARGSLPKEEETYLKKLKKGFEGEKEFDLIAKQVLGDNVIMLNDLVFVINGTTVQIDSLILSESTVTLLEIKNFEGKYELTGSHFKSLIGFEIINPLNQLNRSVTLVSQLLSSWNNTLNVAGSIVFINPSFYLFGDKPEMPFVYSNFLKAYLKESQGNQTMGSGSRLLADKLLKECKQSYVFNHNLPDYSFEGLKKGLICPQCYSLKIRNTQRMCYCENCKGSVLTDIMVINLYEEMIQLFSTLKITTPLLQEWADHKISEESIRRILNHYFKAKGNTKGRYYENNH